MLTIEDDAKFSAALENIVVGSNQFTGYPDTRSYKPTMNKYVKLLFVARRNFGMFSSIRTLLEVTELVCHDDNFKYCFIPDAANTTHKLEFIEDTLKFILTGSRSRSMDSWYTLLSGDLGDTYQNNPLRLHSAEHKAMSRINDILNEIGVPKTASQKVGYINMWCQHHGGLRDMLYSLAILTSYEQ